MEMEKTAAPIDHQQYYNHLQGLATIDPTQPSPGQFYAFEKSETNYDRS
jgi:hypothetical protein